MLIIMLIIITVLGLIWIWRPTKDDLPAVSEPPSYNYWQDVPANVTAEMGKMYEMTKTVVVGANGIETVTHR